jgi:hypothetical protein
MSETVRQSARLLHESIAPYSERATRSNVIKLSISLPADLVEIVRTAAAENAMSVSATIAAALRRTLGDAEQARLDAALDAQAAENVEFARAYEPLAAELIAKLEW